MGILKFIFIFFVCYFLIKILRSAFFVTKTIRGAQKDFNKHQQGFQANPGNKKEEDIIDADYKVIDEE